MASWWELVFCILFSLPCTLAGLCPPPGGPLRIRACTNVSYSCALMASASGVSCSDLCASFGTSCQRAYNAKDCGNITVPLTCTAQASDILCYCSVNQADGVCPAPAAPQVGQCFNSNRSCVLALRPPTSVSCNSVCQSMYPSAYCAGAWQTADCFLQASTMACDRVRSNPDQTCRCDVTLPPDPFVSFVSRGESTACRALNTDLASSTGCDGLLGCYYKGIQDGSILSLQDCQDRCRADSACLGIEYGFGGSGNKRCELWHVPSPYVHNASDYECYDRVDARLCSAQPVPYPFQLLETVPCFPMNWGSTCKVTCASGFVPSEIDMVCSRGQVIFPTNVCFKIEDGDFVDNVVVSFALVYDLNATCIGVLDDSEDNKGTISVAACVGFARNVETALGLGKSNPIVTQVTEISDGALCSLMFSSTKTSKASVIVNEFLALKYANISALTSFNISTVNGICEVVTDILKVTISFGSLFAYLTGLPEWVLFMTCSILLVAILVFLYINRRSDHPFALLGAFLSLFSLGGKIVFIIFLKSTFDQLSANSMKQTEFFEIALACAVGILAFSFVFNFICTTLLFRRHALKNYDAFATWVPKHRCGVALVLLLCGLNPASFLILCSNSFGKDVFRAPVSLRAQNQFQAVGLLSVLIGDGPPICLHVLTLLLVADEPMLQWGGGSNSILIPLIFSSAVIAVGILRRSILICVAPLKVKTMAAESECTSSQDETREGVDESAIKPSSVSRTFESSSFSRLEDPAKPRSAGSEPPSPPTLHPDSPPYESVSNPGRSGRNSPPVKHNSQPSPSEIHQSSSFQFPPPRVHEELSPRSVRFPPPGRQNQTNPNT